MKRRNFIEMGSLLAASTLPGYAFGGLPNSTTSDHVNHHVDFIYDGIKLSPSEYTLLLTKLVDEGKIKPDYYSNGGVVEELENKFAALLGKESAVFMPIGTLANHVAVRNLARDKRRVIVQEQSHLYNDSGDCAQTLSNLNLIPLSPNEVSITLEDIEQVNEKTKSGRVETKVGVISIESPVRRKRDCTVEYDRMKEIAVYAQNNDIRMHLDGARLFVQSVHSDIEPKIFGNLFDTVYTSMYKCFNAPSGAILAGNTKFTEKLFHQRRMFGGGLPSVWPFAAIALHYADSFIEEYRTALHNAEILFSILLKEERFEVIKFRNGSHVVGLNVKANNLTAFRDSLTKRNINLQPHIDSGFLLKINPTINRINPENVADNFLQALRDSE